MSEYLLGLIAIESMLSVVALSLIAGNIRVLFTAILHYLNKEAGK